MIPSWTNALWTSAWLDVSQVYHVVRFIGGFKAADFRLQSVWVAADSGALGRFSVGCVVGLRFRRGVAGSVRRTRVRDDDGRRCAGGAPGGRAVRPTCAERTARAERCSPDSVPAEIWAIKPLHDRQCATIPAKGRLPACRKPTSYAERLGGRTGYSHVARERARQALAGARELQARRRQPRLGAVERRLPETGTAQASARTAMGGNTAGHGAWWTAGRTAWQISGPTELAGQKAPRDWTVDGCADSQTAQAGPVRDAGRSQHELRRLRSVNVSKET